MTDLYLSDTDAGSQVVSLVSRMSGRTKILFCFLDKSKVSVPWPLEAIEKKKLQKMNVSGQEQRSDGN